MRSRDSHRIGHDPTHAADEVGSFELWHARTRNLHGTYRTRNAALEGVWTALREQGETYADGLILAAEDARGETRRIAAGEDLLALAEQAAVRHPAVDPAPDASRGLA